MGLHTSTSILIFAVRQKAQASPPYDMPPPHSTRATTVTMSSSNVIVTTTTSSNMLAPSTSVDPFITSSLSPALPPTTSITTTTSHQQSSTYVATSFTMTENVQPTTLPYTTTSSVPAQSAEKTSTSPGTFDQEAQSAGRLTSVAVGSIVGAVLVGFLIYWLAARCREKQVWGCLGVRNRKDQKELPSISHRIWTGRFPMSRSETVAPLDMPQPLARTFRSGGQHSLATIEEH